MGAKSATKLRGRGTAHKCDLCGRKLMTNQALKSHLRSAHHITKTSKPKAVLNTARNPKAEVKPIKSVPISRVSPKPKAKEVKNTEAEKNKDEAVPKKNTVEFECPKCFSIFSTYFPAHKHIQKYHCVNRQGMKVPPNSPSLIQPVRIELCVKCNRKVKSIQTHVCDVGVKDQTEGQTYICLACEEYFTNLKLFDLHVLNLHGNEVESMFFPTNIEFTKWKAEMEVQTNVSYAVLDKYDSKRYYHCNYVKKTPDKNRTTHFCPSTIVIQEFSKGIQVHFYRQHYKHTFTPYSLMDKYKKYSITAFLKHSEEYNSLPISKSLDNDIYLQFKTLMEGIVVDAAKINISTLNILLGKALEMTSILTNYDEEIDDSNVKNNQSMNDSQITKALEEANITIGNQVTNVVENLTIDDKDEAVPSPRIINSFSLAKPTITVINEDNVTVNTNIDTNLTPVKPMNEMESPSSFNDSYKDFVVKNFKIPEENVGKTDDVSKRTRQRQVVKTKIGQYSPKSLKPKEDTNKSKQEEVDSQKKDMNVQKLKDVSEDDKNVDKREDDKRVRGSPKKLNYTKRVTKNILETKYKSFIGMESKGLNTLKKVPKRIIEEQKPDEADSPKRVKFNTKKMTNTLIDKKQSKHILNIQRKHLLAKQDSMKKLNLKPKLDIEYEVKEQENDCNILILKL